MSYIALARKWRPRQFSQLVGQVHINKALSNSLSRQRLHHAYLFTGTRGVGKTSIARLFAKAINCAQGIQAEPCLQCDACLAIEQGCFVDLIEIDGASRTRVEDTREILENVQYLPTNGRFKVYLIDEVHMLSQHSFNALLKTLEEPPPHVKFLLATTDPQKLPVTVLSRCLQFNLKPIPPHLIEQYLQFVLEQEQLAFDAQGLSLIAAAARGSMRDALSLLDQAIALSGQSIQIQDVKAMLGYTQEDYATELLVALAEANPTRLLQVTRTIAEEGGNYHYVLDQLLLSLHQIMISQCIAENPLPDASHPELNQLSTQFTQEDIQLFYQIGLKGAEEIHLAPTLAVGFEMTLLRMYAFKPASQAATPPLQYESAVTPQNSVPSAESGLSESLPGKHHQTQVTNHPLSSSPCVSVGSVNGWGELDSTGTQRHIEPSGGSGQLQDHNAISVKSDPHVSWESLLPKLGLTGLALSAASQAELDAKIGAQVTLCVDQAHQSIFTSNVTQRIEQALRRYYQDDSIQLKLKTGQSVTASPAQKKKIEREVVRESAEKNLQGDEFFQQLQQTFSAELVHNSIASTKNSL